MKINLKLRLKNKATLTAIFSTLLLLARQVGLPLPDGIGEVFNTALSLLVLMGVVIDPTTHGLADSEAAMKYEHPKKD